MREQVEDMLADTPHESVLATPLLELVALSKQYPGVLALDQVNFELRSGEVHVLFGENGAGKSTLINIIAGAQTPTSGEIRIRGAKTQLHSVHQARGLGISAVFQEFSLVPTLSVEENLFLGGEPKRFGLLDKTAMRSQAQRILRDLGFELDPDVRVQHLSRAEQQMVEIAKAFRSKLSVLILDEPTASLTEKETEQLFGLIRKATETGVGVIYITHRMAEIRRIGDRVTVLRDGKYVATVDSKTTPDDELVRLMTGRVVGEIFPQIKHAPKDMLLSIEALSTANRTVIDASLSVRAGEVVGIAGLIGSGKSEIARACFGLERITSGSVIFKGNNVTGSTPRQMMERGLFYLPPDRRAEGLVMMRSCRENISLPSLTREPYSRMGLLMLKDEREHTHELASRLNLQPARIERNAEHFSGGNQQKVLLAKSLTRPVNVFVFDEPTVGVDVATRAAIYQFIRDLTEQGAGILLISSDLPEVLHLSNRLYVMYRGQIQAELAAEEINEEKVLGYFFHREAA
jgi:ribose transport system ATP-binding protein